MSTTAPAEHSSVGGGGASGGGGAGGGSGGSGGGGETSKLPRPSSSSSAAANVTSTPTITTTPTTPPTTNSSAQESSSGIANRPTKRKVTAAAEERSGAAASSGQTPRDPSTTANTLAPQPHIQHPRPQHPNLNAPGVKSPTPATRSPAPSRSPAPPQPSRSPARKQSPAITLSREGSAVTEELEDSNNNLPSGMRTPRGNPTSSSSSALETVVESSLPSTPAIGTSRMLTEQMAVLAARQPSKIPEDDDDESQAGSAKTIRQGRAGSIASSLAPSSRHESESESGYRTNEDLTPTRPNSAKRPQAQKQPTYTRRPTVTGKEIAQQGMTVETETVSSIPQVGLGNVGPPGSASLRSKKSTDTIRAPRREKRKLRRTVPSGVSNASTKSELFAIKVAEAVNQANSSDSDETFVYESNPPESAQRPSSRFHSRTPSATSVGGPENRGLRLPLLAIDGTTSTGRGKGMKFVNNSINKNADPSEDDARPTAGPSRERNRQQRSVLTDDDHPFRHRSTHQTLRHAASNLTSTPEPTSPKLLARSTVPVRKAPRQWTQYEADIEGFEDDESTPLVRRNRAARRGAGYSARNPHRRRSWARTYFACIIALMSTTLVLSGIAGFLITTTNPLQNVHLVNVTDVLVSKQEIMLDLVVGAINPNIIPVTIGSMDINIFAKSAHIREPEDEDDDDDDDGGDDNDGTAPDPDDPFNEFFTREGVDKGTDPDAPEDKETMLLGRIFAFDSVLQFEGTPWNKRQQISAGELRLQRPGNKTEEGGTERWERVLAHPFELIVRGVLKYQLPLSGRVRTASVAGRVGIWPEGESDEVDGVRI